MRPARVAAYVAAPVAAGAPVRPARVAAYVAAPVAAVLLLLVMLGVAWVLDVLERTEQEAGT